MEGGKHLIINAHSENKALFESVDLVRELIEDIVKGLSFTKLSDIEVVKGTVMQGITGFVIIETSHVSIHTFADNGFVALDIYSCKDFDHKIVFDILKDRDVNDIDFNIVLR
jgi:S-adenosylmethionine decarboxylase